MAKIVRAVESARRFGDARGRLEACPTERPAVRRASRAGNAWCGRQGAAGPRSFQGRSVPQASSLRTLSIEPSVVSLAPSGSLAACRLRWAFSGSRQVVRAPSASRGGLVAASGVLAAKIVRAVESARRFGDARGRLEACPTERPAVRHAGCGRKTCPRPQGPQPVQNDRRPPQRGPHRRPQVPCATQKPGGGARAAAPALPRVGGQACGSPPGQGRGAERLSRQENRPRTQCNGTRTRKQRDGRDALRP